MTKALIFDFDGVLGMSDVPRFNALREICARSGLELTDEHFPQMIGKTSADVLDLFFPGQDPAVLAAILDEYRAEHKGNIEKYVTPVDVTVGFIRDYKGAAKLAVASMNTMDTIERLTAHFGIAGRFDAIVSRGDVTHPKPHPEAYMKAAEMLDIKPSDCAVIEDTALGATSALNAGMSCYAFLNGFNSETDFADLPISGFIISRNDLEALV